MNGAIRSHDFLFEGRQYVAEIVLDGSRYFVEIWDVTEDDAAMIYYARRFHTLDDAESEFEWVINRPSDYV